MTEYKAVLEQDTGATILVRVSPNKYSEYSIDGNNWYPFINTKNEDNNVNITDTITIEASDYKELVCNVTINKNKYKVILELKNTNNIPYVEMNLDLLNPSADLWIIREPEDKPLPVIWGGNCIIDETSLDTCADISYNLSGGITLLKVSKENDYNIITFKGTWGNSCN